MNVFFNNKQIIITELDSEKTITNIYNLLSGNVPYSETDTNAFKLNDSIYYNSWKDYFYNLLLHNYFFPDTAYDLIGFTKDNDILYAVVQQAYVSITANTDLKQVKEFLTLNGFENNRNNDYINRELGIILEDLHDENVLTRNEVLYFIDTVFYVTDAFWDE